MMNTNNYNYQFNERNAKMLALDNIIACVNGSTLVFQLNPNYIHFGKVNKFTEIRNKYENELEKWYNKFDEYLLDYKHKININIKYRYNTFIFKNNLLNCNKNNKNIPKIFNFKYKCGPSVNFGLIRKKISKLLNNIILPQNIEIFNTNYTFNLSLPYRVC